MKKLLAVVLAAAMVLSLGACSAVKTDTQAAAKTEETAEAAVVTKDPYGEAIKIAYIPHTYGDTVGTAWGEGIEAELSNFDNVTFNVFDGQASAENQTKIIEDLINQQYDGIILQATDSAVLAAPVQKAEAAGIPVVCANLDADTPHSALVAMVDIEAGKAVARAIGDALGGNGKCVIIQATPGASKGELLDKGFKQVLADEYPGLELLDEQTGNWVTEDANTVMTDFLTKYPDIDAVFCHNDAMAEGAAEAAKAAGKDGLLIWGADGETKMLEYIEQGLCYGTIYTDCREQGRTLARQIMYHISAGVRPNLTKTPIIKMAPIVVTPDNVDSITPAMRW